MLPQGLKVRLDILEQGGKGRPLMIMAGATQPLVPAPMLARLPVNLGG